MEPNHLSIEDEKFHKEAPCMKSELGESNIHHLQKNEETGHIGEVQNGSPKVPESRSFISTNGKDSASDSSFTIGDEYLKTSDYLKLSFASTAATCGSSSPYMSSTEEELLGDLEDIGEKRETVNNDSTQNNNQGDQKSDEAVHSTSLTTGSSSTVQKGSLKMQEGRLSSNTILKESKNNISFSVGSENLKDSDSRLSLSSTAATCGSSSPDMMSSEEEELAEQEGISKKRDTKHVWNLENPISGLPRRTLKHISNSPSAIFFSITQLDNKYQTTDGEFTGAKLSSFQEDSNSLKSSPAMKESQEADALQHITTEEFPLKMPLSTTFAYFSDMEDLSLYKNSISDPAFLERAPSLCNSSLDCFSDIQEPHSNNNQINILPLEGKVSSLNATEDGTSEISDYSATPGVFPSATVLSGSNLENASQTTKWTFNNAKETSFQKDLSSLKSPDMRHNLEALALPSLRNGKLSKHIKETNVPSKMTLFSSVGSFSNIKEPSSHKSRINVSPLVRKGSSINSKEVETSKFSDCDTISGGVGNKSNRHNYDQKEGESVRRKVKTEPPTSSKTDALLTNSSEPKISCSSKEVGRALLETSKSLKEISPEEADWDLYKNCGGSAEVKYFVPKPWVEELISSLLGIAIADSPQGLETDNLLEKVHHFFKNNFVDADVNLSREESKHRIITSKYFNDEFSRRHGLFSDEKPTKECLKDLKSYTSPNQRIQLELLEMCQILMELCIPEETFTEYVGRQILVMCGSKRGVESIGEILNRERQEYFYGLLFSLEEDFDFVVMVKLYAKLMYERATFKSIIHESRKSSAAEKKTRRRELLSTAQASSRDSYYLSNVYADYLSLTGTLTQNETVDIVCPSNSEGVVLQKDKSTTEPSKTPSRESTEPSNVVSVSDSNELDSSVTAESEFCYEKTSMPPSKATQY